MRYASPMVEQAPKSRRRQSSATTHHEPYPARLHRHVSAAVEAAAALLVPVEAEPGAPTPVELVDRYAASQPVNTTESEVMPNE